MVYLAESANRGAPKRGAAGGGAGRSWAWGDGGAETRGAFKLPESIVIMPGGPVVVDSSLGSIRPSTKVPSFAFEQISPREFPPASADSAPITKVEGAGTR